MQCVAEELPVKPQVLVSEPEKGACSPSVETPAPAKEAPVLAAATTPALNSLGVAAAKTPTPEV